MEGENPKGSWITPDGEIIEVNHAEDLHHYMIAMDHIKVGSKADRTRDGDFDQYPDFLSDDAIEKAWKKGWVKISFIDHRLNISWLGSMKRPARAALAGIIDELAFSAKSYEIQNSSFMQMMLTRSPESYDDVNDFLKALKRARAI